MEVKIEYQPRNGKKQLEAEEKEMRRKAIEEFELMRNTAELRALSKVSLERPLDDQEFKRINELAKQVLGGVV